MVASGNISRNQPQPSSISYQSKDISELFPTASTSSYFILIEGAPGIGKTVLSKEIAYQWAENKILTFKKLVFLLFMRDPNLKNMVILENLTQYLCNNNKRGSELSEYLLQTEGKDLTIILDGYDEMSEEDRSNSLVAKIINRTVLPVCDLVVTSRPTASLHLRDTADCRVEVLGFTEEDRLDYIRQALKGSHDKIEVLQFYLQSNSTINALCYVPLNMTILLCLYENISALQKNTLNVDSIKEIGLPNTQTEMYEKFILMTVTRCIKKNNKQFSGKYLKISELPEPYNEIFNELLQLAYYALKQDKIVFNSDEEFIQRFCKNLKSGNCEGLGLLKVTEHVTSVSFHFLHFSIREYLAAYYIASQSSSFQVQLLRTTFWDIHYFNTWIMYVGITGGTKVAWKHYISGNRFMLSTKMFKSSKISKSLLNDKIKSLHLFQCFSEIGNKELIGKIFKDKIIDLSNQTLLPRDMNILCFFLLRSTNKHWIKMDLSNCNIGGIGSDVLYTTFLDKSRDIVGVDKVDFSSNLLQNQSILKLLDVVKFWHASEVIINEDRDNYGNLFKLCLDKFSLYSDEDSSQSVLVGPFLFAHKSDQQLIYNQLTNSSNLTGLYLNCFNYQVGISRFLELKHKLNLSKLHVIGRNFIVEFFVALVQTMNEVDSIYIYDNTLSDEDVNYVSSSFLYKPNVTTSGVWVVIGSTKILGNVQNNFTLNKKLSPVEIFNVANSIRRLSSGNSTANFVTNHSENHSIFEDLRNSLLKNVTKCDINFCMIENNLLIANGVKYSDLSEALSLNDQLTSVHITTCNLNVTELEPFVNLISKQKSLQRLYIFDSLLELCCFKELCDSLLTRIPWLQELLIHSTDSSCILTPDLLAVQKSNTSVLLLASNMLIGWHPTSRQLSLTLQLQLNITAWKLPNCHIDVQTFYQLAIMLKDLVELDISGCNLAECEVKEIMQCNKLKDSFKNLTKLNISSIKITNQAFADVANMLSSATKLSDLVLSHNNLSTVCASKLLKNLSLIKLDISFSAINNKTAHDIASVLSQSTELEELNISSCHLQTDTAAIVFKGMKHILNLSKFNVSHNGITDEVANHLAEILSQNVGLKELDLGYNCLHAMGAMTIVRGMKSILFLSKLNISHNNITDEVKDDLAEVLSQNVELTELDFSYNCLQTTGAITILKGMRSILHLSKLNISHNNITDEIKDDLAEVLSQNVGLTELDISYNCLQTAGTITILKGMRSILHLSKLNISHNNITDEVKDDLAEVLSQNVGLTELDISYNCLQTAGAITILKGMRSILHLSKLNISHNNITDEVKDDLAEVLYQNVELTELDISYNCLQTAGAITILKGMRSILHLSKLNISHNNITDEVKDDLAEVLYQNVELTELDISYNCLQTAGAITILKGMRSILHLSKLNISHNNITDEVKDDLADVLSQNVGLTELDISYNCLQTAGAITILKGMRSILHLSKLNISHNNITDEVKDDLAEVLYQNVELTELDISYNCLQTAGAITILKGMRSILHLSKLNISHNNITDEVKDDLAEVLSQNVGLKELNLSYSYLRTAGAVTVFKGMDSISQLSKFSISHNAITDKAADLLAGILNQNVRLKELDLSYNSLQATGATIVCKGISALINLTKLNISNNNISSEAARDIAVVLSHNISLEELDLSCNNFGAFGAVQILKDFIGLIKLNIGSIGMTDFAAVNIATVLNNNINLKELDLSNNNIQPLGATKFFSNAITVNLNKLNISHNCITDQGADDIAMFISQNTELQELDLSHNNLQIGGIVKICRTNISKLIKLNISHNNITTDHEASNDVSTFLSLNNKLQLVDLSYNNLEFAGIFKNMEAANNISVLNIYNCFISSEAAKELAILLLYSSKLKEINLSHNDLSTTDAIKVFKGMKNISDLVAINISHNMITNEAAESIANVLLYNTKLKELDVSHNYFSASGIIKIFQEMKKVSSLITLNISHNMITDEAAESIATVLCHNRNLQTLSVSSNYLRSAGCAEILSRLKSMKCLTKLDISCNKIAFNVNPVDTSGISYLSSDTVDTPVTILRPTLIDYLGAVLSQNTLKELDISSSYLQTAGAIKIFQNIETFTQLNIAHNMITDEATEHIAAVLSNCRELVELNLSHNDFHNMGALCMPVSKLTKIDFSYNNIDEQTVTELSLFLSRCTKLEELNLANSNLQTSGAVKLFKTLTCKALKIINISGNCIKVEAADHIAISLSKSNKLQEIYLSCNVLQMVGIRTILATISISNLTKLNISDNGIIQLGGKIIRNILVHAVNLVALDFSYNKVYLANVSQCSCSSLVQLNMCNSRITDEAAPALALVLSMNSKLQELDISHNYLKAKGISKIFEKFDINLNLTKLNLSNNVIDERAADMVGNFLSKNTKLKELDISCNNLCKSGTKALCKRITNLSKLTKLKVGGNDFTHLAAHVVGKVLLHNINLEEIDLSDNTLLAAGAASVFNGMKYIFTLRNVNISNNWITYEAAGNIAAILSQNTHLRKVYLSKNYLEANGIITLCRGMSNIQYLTHLDMSCNKITDEAAHDIATFLYNNPELEVVDFSNNLMQTQGAKILCKAIRTLKNLRTLNVSNNVITDEAADDIVLLHSTSQSLQGLDLSYNNISMSGTVRIFKAMRYIKNLTIDISHNAIPDETTDKLATMILHNTSLRVLDISNLYKPVLNINSNVINEIISELVITLLNSTELEELDLSYNRLSTSDAARIFKGMKNISNLTALNVSHNLICDEAADELAIVLLHNTNLEKLDFGFNDLSTSDIIKIFKGMKNISNLKTINIYSNNMITDKAADSIAAILSHNSKLKALDMSFNCLGSKACNEIFNGMKNISYLTHLNISHNKITREATGNIAAVLSHNTKIEELDISYNDLQTPGAIEIFQSIKHSSTLRKLNIAHNMITEKATEHIINILYNKSELKELNLSDNRLLEKDVIVKLIDFVHNSVVNKQISNKSPKIITNLQELDFSNISSPQVIGAINVFKELIHNNSSLTKVNISRHPMTPSAAHNLAIILSKNNDLQELVMSYNNLQTRDINTILGAVELSNLTKLNIRGNNTNLMTVMKVLSHYTNLVELDLSYNRLLNAADITWFFSVSKNIFTNLIKLNISGIFCDLSDEAATDLAYIFSQSNKLNELDLSDNNLNPEAASIILNGLNASTLIKFRIGRNNITDEVAGDIASFLCKCTNLEELDLSYNSLQDSGATKISRANISSLVSFNISHNNITIKAADDVANFLSCNSQMQTFDLSCNGLLEVGVRNVLKDMQVVHSILNLSVLNIGEGSVISETVSELVTILLYNTGLKEFDLSLNSLFISDAVNIFHGMGNISNLVAINLSHTYITDEAADELATVLLHNTSLRNIDLSYNNLSTSDAMKIFKGMKNISKLEAINISHNMITDEAADELANVLLHNTSLQNIDLSYNNLSTSDAMKIFKGMKNMSKLEAINISHNMITDEAADELATVLLHNTSLQNIDLSYNNLSTSDAMKIFKGMKNISKLEAINISHNMITDEAADELATVLSHNNGLEIFDMSSNSFSSEGCIKLMNGMSNTLYLKKIDISYNQITYKAANSIATFLSHSSKLEELILSCNDFQKSCLFKKIRSEKLTKFHVKFTLLEVDDIANVLMHNTELEDLDLSNNKLLSDGITRICLTMKNILNLKRIDVSCNRITSEAADDIANILSRNTNLQELYLSNNYLQSHGIVTLFNKMSTVSKLTHLDISSNKITDEAANEIADFLLHNSKLKVLDLSNNLIQAAGARIIFGKSRTNIGLKKLNLSLNAVDDEAADIIASFLSQNPSLEELDFSKNYLQAVGAIKIFKAIQNCPSILKVNMRNNWISDEAGDEIAYVLSTVTKLQEVDLDCNLLSAEMSDYIKKHLS